MMSMYRRWIWRLFLSSALVSMMFVLDWGWQSKWRNSQPSSPHPLRRRRQRNKPHRQRYPPPQL